MLQESNRVKFTFMQNIILCYNGSGCFQWRVKVERKSEEFISMGLNNIYYVNNFHPAWPYSADKKVCELF